jgi:hypothetical protein
MREDLKYPFGFLLTKYQFSNPYKWREYRLQDGWELYYSPSNEFSELSSQEVKIAILGYFFDTRDGNLSSEKILERLVYSIKTSYDTFLYEIGFLNGRYLIIVSYQGETKLYNDVTGLRSVCFHEEKGIIGSHDTLVNEVTGNQLEQVHFNAKEISFSYNTRFKSVQKLIPNMSLEINTKRLERYYPTKNHPIKSKDEIKAELKFYLSETVKWIERSDYRPILSITGGGDSRMSLAALKPIVNKLETFTYLKDTTNYNNFIKDTFENDNKIVKSIVNNLNLNHNFFVISTNQEVDQSIIKTIKHNVLSDHGLNLAHDYYKIYGRKNYMHIRSTGLFNVGKYIFPRETLEIKNWDKETIARYVKKWTDMTDEIKLIEHLDHLLKHAQLENFYNYNPLELLFVSHRMIQRHSGLVNESDIAFNTMLLLNSRHILDLLLSYPIEDRKENELLKDMVDELWPILNYWSINSTKDLSSKYKSAVREISNLKRKYKLATDEINELKVVNNQLFLNFVSTYTTQETGLSCVSHGNGQLYKFASNDIKENETYELRINLSKINNFNQLRFKLQFFYKNIKGRNKITVMTNFLPTNSLDILDLYGENEVIINAKELGEQKELSIKVRHHSSTNSKSWVDASRIWIGDFQFIMTK